MKLHVNGTVRELDVPDEMPLLWVLRDALGLTGVKYGCGMAQCGACTVIVDDQPVFSCLTPCAGLEGKKVRTVESLGTAEHPGGHAPLEQGVDVVGGEALPEVLRVDVPDDRNHHRDPGCPAASAPRWADRMDRLGVEAAQQLCRALLEREFGPAGAAELLDPEG